jgi:hypothetical protein
MDAAMLSCRSCRLRLTTEELDLNLDRRENLKSRVIDKVRCLAVRYFNMDKTVNNLYTSTDTVSSFFLYDFAGIFFPSVYLERATSGFGLQAFLLNILDICLVFLLFY